MQIALSINARDIQTARDLVLRAPNIVGPLGIVHMDVHEHSFNGVLVPKGIKTEVHIMALDWEECLPLWLEAGVFRVILPHAVLAGKKAGLVRELAARYGAEVMPSFAYGDVVTDFSPYAGFSSFQVLAVPQGTTGHAFAPQALLRLKALRAAFPDAILEIDGGITPLTALKAQEAGANVAVSSSYIWGAESPHAAYEALERI